MTLFETPLPAFSVLFITVPIHWTSHQHNTCSLQSSALMSHFPPSSKVYRSKTPPFLPQSECFIVTKQTLYAGRSTKSGQSRSENWACLGCKETICLLADTHALTFTLATMKHGLDGAKITLFQTHVLFSKQSHFFVLILFAWLHWDKMRKSWNAAPISNSYISAAGLKRLVCTTLVLVHYT